MREVPGSIPVRGGNYFQKLAIFFLIGDKIRLSPGTRSEKWKMKVLVKKNEKNSKWKIKNDKIGFHEALRKGRK